MKKALIVISSLLLLAACEQAVDTDGWPAHEEKLVVAAYLHLEHDSIFAYARVGRTLPLGEKFDLQKAMVNDAEVIVDNGNRSFPMSRAQGFDPYDFDFNYAAVAARGTDDRFTLTVSQGGNTAGAAIDVRSVVLKFDTLWLERGFNDFGYPIYIVHYRIPAPGIGSDVECRIESGIQGTSTWQDVGSFTLPSQTNRPDGLLEGSTTTWDPWSGTPKRPTFRLTLIAHNRAYQNYINSRWDWSGGDSPFDPPQKNPPFNVTGDGIGFFWYEFVGEPVEIQY